MTSQVMSCKETLKKYIAWLSEYSEPSFNIYAKELLSHLPDDIDLVDARLLFEEYKTSNCEKILNTLIAFSSIFLFQTLIKKDLSVTNVMDYIQYANTEIVYQLKSVARKEKYGFLIAYRGIQNKIENIMITCGKYQYDNTFFDKKSHKYSKILKIYDVCMQTLGRFPFWHEFKEQLPVDYFDAYTLAINLNLPFSQCLYKEPEFEDDTFYDMTHITFTSTVLGFK